MKLKTELKDLLQDLVLLDERYDTNVHEPFLEELMRGLDDELEVDDLQDELKSLQAHMEREEFFGDDEQRRVVTEIINRLPTLL